MPLWAGILIAALTLAGALAFLALVLWGAREDGREQRAYEDALRRYRRGDDAS